MSALRKIDNSYGELLANSNAIVIPLKHGSIVGRATGYDISGLSREHFLIQYIGGALCIVDLGSTKGTTLNGNFIQPRITYPIKHGDQIKAGTMVFVVQLYANEHQSVIPKKFTLMYDQASFFSRVIAFAIDLVALIVGSHFALVYAQQNSTNWSLLKDISVLLGVHFVLILLPILLFSRSPGKILLGLKIVSKYGETLGLFNAFFREGICKILMMFSIPIVSYYFTQNGLAWLGGILFAVYFISHPIKYYSQSRTFWDDWCGTYVVSGRAKLTKENQK